MTSEGNHEAYRRQITETNVPGYYPSIMARMTYVRCVAVYDFGPSCATRFINLNTLGYKLNLINISDIQLKHT